MFKYAIFSTRGIASLVAVGAASWAGGFYLGKNKIPLSIMTIYADSSSLVPFDSKMSQVQVRTSEIMKYGFPSLENVRSFEDYVLSYDRRNKVPNWVFEHLTADRLKVTENVDRSKCQFMEDKSIHPYFRATNQDYFRSGYDRGHMAAAGNHKLTQKHCEETFYLTNIAPQVGEGFNRHAWNRLEKYVRGLTKTYPNVYVCTGPMYLARREADSKWYIKYEVIGVNQVAVPTHFFKVVVMETQNGEFHLECYIMPNQPIDDGVPLSTFLVEPENVERHSGLLFFDRLSRTKLTKVNGHKSTTV